MAVIATVPQRLRWWLLPLAAALVLLGAGCGAPRPAVQDRAQEAATPPAAAEEEPAPRAAPADSSPSAPAAAEPVATPPAAEPAASLAAGAADAPLAVIRQAYREITGRLYREVAPRELLSPVWRAIGAEVRRQGIPDAHLRRHEAAGVDDFDAFAREFTGFVEETGPSLDASRLGSVAVRAMATAVGDSHTRFLTPEQADNQRRSVDGDTSYSGIGIRIDGSGGALTITEVYVNTPADRAGLRAGDQIVRVNGRDTRELDDISAHVRGPEGTEVHLTIQRAGEGPRDVTLNRARIAIPVVVSRLLDGDVGYIRITSFPRKSGATDAARDFDEQLNRLIALGARGLVLDLRGNPGGDPFTSVAVASNFVPEGPIFISVNREGRRTTYPAASRPTVFRGPVAVLVDWGTASGAEVVASALQEYGSGYLVGTRTCGCLSVGRPLQLGDSSGLIVTVEQALTGRTERSLEGVGLEPDEVVAAAPGARNDPQQERGSRPAPSAVQAAPPGEGSDPQQDRAMDRALAHLRSQLR